MSTPTRTSPHRLSGATALLVEVKTRLKRGALECEERLAKHSLQLRESGCSYSDEHGDDAGHNNTNSRAI